MTLPRASQDQAMGSCQGVTSKFLNVIHYSTFKGRLVMLRMFDLDSRESNLLFSTTCYGKILR